MGMSPQVVVYKLYLEGIPLFRQLYFSSDVIYMPILGWIVLYEKIDIKTATKRGVTVIFTAIWTVLFTSGMSNLQINWDITMLKDLIALIFLSTTSAGFVAVFLMFSIRSRWNRSLEHKYSQNKSSNTVH